MFSNANHYQLKNSVNSIATPIIIIELDTPDAFRVVSCNDLLADMMNIEQSQIIGSALSDIIPQYLFDQMYGASFSALKNQNAEEFEININRFGSNRWWKCFITPIVNTEETAKRAMITFLEITERKLLSKELVKANNRFKAIVISAHDGIISIDTNEKILQANEAAKKIFGSDKLVGQSLKNLLPRKYRAKHPDYVKSFKESDVCSRPMDLRATVMGLRADGTEIPLEITIARINVDGETEMTAVIRDITEKNKLIHELNHISTIDNLTSLYNRRYLTPFLKKEFGRARRYSKSLSILFIDIDHFKQFNDNYGHLIGDMILQQVSKIILEQLREIDTACRWGGEEFVVVAPEIRLDEAVLLADRLRTSIQCMECQHENQEFEVTVTIGVAGLSTEDESTSDLIERADKLMLKGKKLGRNRVVSE